MRDTSMALSGSTIEAVASSAGYAGNAILRPRPLARVAGPAWQVMPGRSPLCRDAEAGCNAAPALQP